MISLVIAEPSERASVFASLTAPVAAVRNGLLDFLWRHEAEHHQLLPQQGQFHLALSRL